MPPASSLSMRSTRWAGTAAPAWAAGTTNASRLLNQLLVEMDGFESNEGVILIAATNRPDVLDPALLRPGRFDRRVMVARPDVKGREGILQVHTKKIPLSEDVDVSVLARGTPGFSGADLANLVNEAALNAARYDKQSVTMLDFEGAKDKVLMGVERKSLIISDAEKRNTAYHEAGHALVAAMLPQADPLHKVTIIPRGMALGVTMQLPEDDKHTYTRDFLESQIAIMMGGRVAEEMFLEHMTTGAGNDIEQATEMARRMVCDYGMSKLGPLTFGKREEQIFLGREIAQHRDYSEDTAIKIDQEIKRFVNEGYQHARKILEENRDTLIRIAETLLEREVLDADEVRSGHPEPPAGGEGGPALPGRFRSSRGRKSQGKEVRLPAGWTPGRQAAGKAGARLVVVFATPNLDRRQHRTGQPVALPRSVSSQFHFFLALPAGLRS